MFYIGGVTKSSLSIDFFLVLSNHNLDVEHKVVVDFLQKRNRIPAVGIILISGKVPEYKLPNHYIFISLTSGVIIDDNFNIEINWSYINDCLPEDRKILIKNIGRPSKQGEALAVIRKLHTNGHSKQNIRKNKFSLLKMNMKIPTKKNVHLIVLWIER